MWATERTVPSGSCFSASRTEYSSRPTGIDVEARAFTAQGSTAERARNERRESDMSESYSECNEQGKENLKGDDSRLGTGPSYLPGLTSSVAAADSPNGELVQLLGKAADGYGLIP